MSDGSEYSAPARSGKPWWLWVIGGCTGCAVILILVLVVGGVALRNAFQNTKVAPVTQASVQSSLAGVPLYPGARLEAAPTEMMLRSYAMTERVMGRPQGSMFKGVALLRTIDPPDKVYAFYAKQLKAAGWEPAQASGPKFQRQDMYKKGNDVLIVQAQEGKRRGETGTVIVLIRGSSEMAGHVQQNPPGGSPAQ